MVRSKYTPAREIQPRLSPIEWQQGAVWALPFAEGWFEVVLGQQGLPFVPDPGAVLRERRRVLASGGG